MPSQPRWRTCCTPTGGGTTEGSSAPVPSTDGDGAAAAAPDQRPRFEARSGWSGASRSWADVAAAPWSGASRVATSAACSVSPFARVLEVCAAAVASA